MSKLAIVLISVFSAITVAVAIILFVLYRRKHKKEHTDKEYYEERVRHIEDKLNGGYQGLLNVLSSAEYKAIDKYARKFYGVYAGIKNIERLKNADTIDDPDAKLEKIKLALENKSGLNDYPAYVSADNTKPAYLKQAQEFLCDEYAKEISKEEYKIANCVNITSAVLELAALAHHAGITSEFKKVLGAGGYNIAVKVALDGTDVCLRSLQAIDQKKDSLFGIMQCFEKIRDAFYTRNAGVDLGPGNLTLYTCNSDYLPKLMFSTLDFGTLTPHALANSRPDFFIVEPIYTPIDEKLLFSPGFVDKYLIALFRVIGDIADKNMFYTDFKIPNFMYEKEVDRVILTDFDFACYSKVNITTRKPRKGTTSSKYYTPNKKFCYKKEGDLPSTYGDLECELFDNFYTAEHCKTPSGDKCYLYNILYVKIYMLVYGLADALNLIKFVRIYNEQKAGITSNSFIHSTAPKVVKPKRKGVVSMKGGDWDDPYWDMFGDNKYIYLHDLARMIKHPSSQNIFTILDRENNSARLSEEVRSAVQHMTGCFQFRDSDNSFTTYEAALAELQFKDPSTLPPVMHVHGGGGNGEVIRTPLQFE